MSPPIFNHITCSPQASQSFTCRFETVTPAKVCRGSPRPVITQKISRTALLDTGGAKSAGKCRASMLYDAHLGGQPREIVNEVERVLDFVRNAGGKLTE